ncbi:hypothetical protein FNV43_RR01761 [Rhamnella rubrinervis]|uniref:Uncharacterized protein n=1 Tax=Rhamnella rubrinervis TaxID=2594499 RepID=A0A8K0HRK0_9ROSA|nr:hypothetical protein FNV43_RR01761 [Rhamnella rubrinervis]
MKTTTKLPLFLFIASLLLASVSCRSGSTLGHGLHEDSESDFEKCVEQCKQFYGEQGPQQEAGDLDKEFVCTQVCILQEIQKRIGDRSGQGGGGGGGSGRRVYLK